MDLSTTYLGLKLKHPVVPSSSPLSEDLASIKKMEDAGAAAIVMYSIFEEQIKFELQELDHFLTYGTESYAEALSYFPSIQDYNLGPEEYLEHIRKAKEAVNIPIIGSLNCVSAKEWTDYAKKIEEAGADALELNVYFIPTNPDLTSNDIEKRYVDVLKAVKGSIKIPVAIKLNPYFSNLARVVKQLDDEGVDGLVLFNRFYQPDLDLETMGVVPRVALSTPADIRLPMRWIAILYGKIRASLAATSGIHTAEDALKLLAAGADVTMVCSVLLKNGVWQIREIVKNMTRWMEKHEYESVSQLKGSMSQKSVAEPAAFERANYMKAITKHEYKPR